MVRDITDSDSARSGRGRRAAVIAAAALVLGILLVAQQRPSVSPPAARPGSPPLPRSVGLLAMDARGFSEGWLATGTNLPPWQLWHTGDGGSSWKGSLSLQATTGSFDRVHFFDDRRGYLLVLAPAFDLLGLTGTTRVKSVYSVDDRRAWAFAGGSFGPPTLLYETTDGGATWSIRKPPA